MNVASKKNKGRIFQQWIRDKLRGIFHTEEDIQSKSMGAGGEDILLSDQVRKNFPYSIEAKNQEKVNIWSSYQQAKTNAKDYAPLVFLKRNHHEPLVLMSADTFFDLIQKVLMKSL